MADTSKGNGHFFDLTKGAVPVAVALAMLISVAAAGVGIGRTLRSYDDTQTQVVRLANEVAALQRTLIAERPEDRWSRTDQVLFCWEAERINKGWLCPAVKVNRVEISPATGKP